MCGIETNNAADAVPWHGVNEGRGETTERLREIARRVPPLQGGVGLVGPSSQGVALGCRVAAPLARMPTGAAVALGAVGHMHEMWSVLEPEELPPGSPGSQPEGLPLLSPWSRPEEPPLISPKSQPEGPPLVSPGQRPGNSASHNMVCPKGATPGRGHSQARNLEQTIAGNVAEVLEA